MADRNANKLKKTPSKIKERKTPSNSNGKLYSLIPIELKFEISVND